MEEFTTRETSMATEPRKTPYVVHVHGVTFSTVIFATLFAALVGGFMVLAGGVFVARLLGVRFLL